MCLNLQQMGNFTPQLSLRNTTDDTGVLLEEVVVLSTKMSIQELKSKYSEPKQQRLMYIQGVVISDPRGKI